MTRHGHRTLQFLCALYLSAMQVGTGIASDSEKQATSWLGLRCVISPDSPLCPQTTESKSRTSSQTSASGTSSTSSVSPSATTTGAATSISARYRVTAWNDLGMHCVDGKDYSIMSILPPYNNLHAQVVDRSTGKAVVSGITLTYEAMADPSGSINTSSAGKTNFWQYVGGLYGATPKPNYGLNLGDPAVSNPTPGTKPAAMRYNAAQRWFEAEGLPITPYDDALGKNYYPMVKVVAKDSAGKIIGSTQTVLPVSDEMTCKNCHASGTSAKPDRGWANDADKEKDWKRNILRLHDDKHATDPVYQAALAKLVPTGAGIGIAARADAGNPVLCASCHGSNALNSPGFTVTVGGTGVKISALTSAMHKRHAAALDPLTQVSLNDATNRDACYQCHPGAATKCLRGAMSETPNPDCQNCHGNMAAVGAPARAGWLQQPNCQACHHDSKRELSAVTNPATGAIRAVTDSRFATNPNTPAPGVSLYRFSTGHGKLQCEACHGSTHAEYSAKAAAWSSTHDNDTLQMTAIQGHPGTLAECTACHSSVPLTARGGPHGMHTIGQSWVKEHHDYVEGQLADCAYCHGADYKGSELSVARVTRTYSIGDGRSYTLQAGTKVGCALCHNWPKR